MDNEKTVLGEDELQRALTRIAHEIVERNPDPPAPALVGIHRRGAFLASRLRGLLQGLLDVEVPLGDLDIGFYRDDVARRRDTPVLHASHIDFDVADRTVVIVDDVLYTGRTARAAIEALFDYGRPARVQLAVLADRGHRELPIRPDYVGKNLPTSRAEHVHVRVIELDGVDEVAIAPASLEVSMRAVGPVSGAIDGARAHQAADRMEAGA
jgi:pyrimidine operon attenuation protein / uracil phosphoribosyltransferase